MTCPEVYGMAVEVWVKNLINKPTSRSVPHWLSVDRISSADVPALPPKLVPSDHSTVIRVYTTYPVNQRKIRYYTKYLNGYPSSRPAKALHTIRTASRQWKPETELFLLLNLRQFYMRARVTPGIFLS